MTNITVLRFAAGCVDRFVLNPVSWAVSGGGITFLRLPFLSQRQTVRGRK